mgnify:CR=1 FL=1
MKDFFSIGNKKFKSRLFMGTSRYPNHQIMLESLHAGRIEVVKIERLESVDIFRVHRPYVVIIATSDADLNYKLFEKAREYGSLICVVDTPYLNDFNMPAIAKIGDIRIAISTGGMSPAMSGLLRKRIEELIKFEDVLQVKLQSHIRNVIKKIITNFDGRKKLVYIIMNDKKIKDFLHRNKFDEAKEYAEKIVQMRIKKGYCA